MVVDLNYWTKVFRKLIVLILTILLIFISFKLAIFYMPFLIAFIISLLLEPAIRFLMKKFKFKRKYSSIIVFILISGIIIGLLSWGISSLIEEGSSFLTNMNEYVESVTIKIQKFISKINLNSWNIPESVISTIESSSRELLNTIVMWLQNIIRGVLNFITSIPTIAIYLSITFIALYFICTDKIYILDQVEHHLPEVWAKRLFKHIKDLAKSLGEYLKAEAVLVLISFIISLIGLYIFKFVGMNVKYPLLYAIGIGFVDALPILGSGTIMVPWAIISGVNGDIRLGISVLVLWIVMSVIRQFIEPKIVSNHIGIHPIFTLIAMYTGFKFIGVIGLFIGPIILIILKNVFARSLDQGVIKSIFARDI